MEHHPTGEAPTTLEETCAHDKAHTRAKLRREPQGSMLPLERTLATSASGRVEDWTNRALIGINQLRADFLDHVRVTEGPDGLYAELLTCAPRLAKALQRLLDEHHTLRAALDDLAGAVSDVRADPEQVPKLRHRATRLLDLLVRHRQRGADLVFEAYQTDIGGET